MSQSRYLSRKQLHDLIDRQLDRWQYEDMIPIERGGITVNVQIEHGQYSITIAERSLVKDVERQA